MGFESELQAYLGARGCMRILHTLESFWVLMVHTSQTDAEVRAARRANCSYVTAPSLVHDTLRTGQPAKSTAFTGAQPWRPASLKMLPTAT